MPTSYTIKSLTEEEYQAMRVAAAVSGQSMNRWLLDVIRTALHADGVWPVQPAEQTTQGGTMYAIYQSGANIYGVGASEQAAMADARQWIEGDFDVTTPRARIGGETIGELYMRRCTPRLADAVKRDGGDIAYETRDDGVLDLFLQEG